METYEQRYPEFYQFYKKNRENIRMLRERIQYLERPWYVRLFRYLERKLSLFSHYVWIVKQRVKRIVKLEKQKRMF